MCMNELNREHYFAGQNIEPLRYLCKSCFSYIRINTAPAKILEKKHSTCNQNWSHFSLSGKACSGALLFALSGECLSLCAVILQTGGRSSVVSRVPPCYCKQQELFTESANDSRSKDITSL